MYVCMRICILAGVHASKLTTLPIVTVLSWPLCTNNLTGTCNFKILEICGLLLDI